MNREMSAKTPSRSAWKALHAGLTPQRAAISVPIASSAPISTVIGAERKIHRL